MSGSALLLVAALLSAPLAAHAQVEETARPIEAPETVALVLAPCAATELDTLAILDRLRVELTSDGVDAVRLIGEAEVAAGPLGALGVAVLRVTSIPCESAVATFEVRIDDLLTRKHVERTIDLGEVAPSARPRALALAIAELLRASWAELALVEEPPAGVPAAILEAMRVRHAGLRDARALANPSSAPEPSAPPARIPASAIAASLLVRAFPGARTALIGGRVALDLAFSQAWLARLDLEAGGGSSLDPLGAIEIGAATLGVSVAFAASVGAVLFTIGPRLAGGAAWASGRPYDPSTLAGTGLGPLVYLGGVFEVDIAFADRFSFRFGVEADGVAVSYEARVASIPVAGLSGAGLGAWVGLALLP